MTSAVLQEVQRHIDAGRVRDGARRLLEGLAAGDVAATAELAHWRIAGDLVRRDLAAARDLLRRAGEAGDQGSALLHAYFLAAGVGGDSEWAGAIDGLKRLPASDPGVAEQLNMIAAMDLDDLGFPAARPVGETLSEHPFVACARGLLSPVECNYLRGKGASALQPSLVIDPATGQLVPNPVRRSDGMTFGVYDEDLVINAVNRRIAAFSGTGIEQGEALQMLRYGVGHEYRAHMDALSREPNQRILTVLLYLSDDYEGGETSFPRTGLSFRGRKGDALLFRNVDENGAADPLSLHAGLPVTRGVKLIATRWIRAERFVYPPPPPLLPELG